MSHRMGRTLAGSGAVAVFGLMLWVPMGQQGFLVENWMKLGTFMAPVLLLIAVKSLSKDQSFLDDRRAMPLFLLALYLVHQFEEHWIDLHGRHYAFQASANAMIDAVLGRPASLELLTPDGIFFINTSLVWMTGMIAILRSPESLFPTLALAGITVVNAMTHLAGALLGWRYNPGLLTAFALFIPIAGSYLWRLSARYPGASKQVRAALLWAILAHIIMIAGVVGRIYAYDDRIYFVTLIIWSILPAFLFRDSPAGMNTGAEAS